MTTDIVLSVWTTLVLGGGVALVLCTIKQTSMPKYYGFVSVVFTIGTTVPFLYAVGWLLMPSLGIGARLVCVR